VAQFVEWFDGAYLNQVQEALSFVISESTKGKSKQYEINT
jgi:hypothetical protein